MNNRRRVVVTGLGAVTPLGTGVKRSWAALCSGKSATGPTTRFDATGFHTQVSAEAKDFNPREFLSEKMARRTDRYQQFAIAAAEEAILDARLKIDSTISERVGTSIATAFGGLETITNCQNMFMNGGRGDITPFMVPMFLTNMASGQVAMRFGAKGPNLSLTTACAAGTHAVGDSAKVIQRGEADIMLAGGAEAAIVPILIHSFGTIGVTSGRNGDPARASRPFEADRDGFVPGEGAGVLVLEALDVALRRGARIYAEVMGSSATADAYHVTSPAPGGEGAARCIRLALQDAGLKPEEIDYINAHGTATKMNDSTETDALKAVFGNHAYRVPVSSNKSMIGHTMGASGAIEAIFTILSIRDHIVPPTINYEKRDPDCDLDYVPNVARKVNVRTALSDSFGFGGVNGVVVFREFNE
ncbi:MAG: beta-ketoacyl-ACP synthase II [Chloroflexi bacterium]|nr:beta-ketoacyl-ACP synthase II [Chloroflexota bacterium]